jgi:hypothetical protein
MVEQSSSLIEESDISPPLRLPERRHQLAELQLRAQGGRGALPPCRPCDRGMPSAPAFRAGPSFDLFVIVFRVDTRGGQVSRPRRSAERPPDACHAYRGSQNSPCLAGFPAGIRPMFEHPGSGALLGTIVAHGEEQERRHLEGSEPTTLGINPRGPGEAHPTARGPANSSGALPVKRWVFHPVPRLRTTGNSGCASSVPAPQP